MSGKKSQPHQFNQQSTVDRIMGEAKDQTSELKWDKELATCEYDYAIMHSYAKIIKLTPKEATELLKMNTHNRKIKESVVMRYAVDMAEGNWRYNGVPVVLSDDNEVLDGQHRLLAVELQDEGFFITVLLVTGVRRESQSTVDQNVTRRLEDVLTLADFQGVDSQVSAGIRMYLIWDNDWLFTDNKYITAHTSKPAMEKWAMEHTDVIELLRRGMHFIAAPARNGVLLAVYAKIAEIHGTDTADVFMQSVSDGVGLEVGNPVLALRNRLIKIRTDKLRVPDREIIAYFVNAFNNWKRGNKITRVQMAKGSWTKENFPKLVTK